MIPQEAFLGHWERRDIVCYLFFSDVTSGLSFNGSNMTTTLLVWFGVLYLLLWAGEDAADVRTVEVFLLGGGQSQALLEAGGEWGEWSQHPHVSSALQLRCWEIQGKSRSHVTWSLSFIVHPHATKCLPWTSVKSLCVQELLLCSAQELLRTIWGGTWL